MVEISGENICSEGKVGHSGTGPQLAEMFLTQQIKSTENKNQRVLVLVSACSQLGSQMTVLTPAL